MHICLNRGTAGRDLPYDEFVKLSSQAGFPGVDVDMGWGQMQGAKALRDLLATHDQKPGGWGPAIDWRGDIAKLNDGLPNLTKQAKVAQELGIDSCATYILPSSDLPFLENWNFHVQRLKRVAEMLANHGLRFGLEFVAPYHLRRRWKHEFIFTVGQMLELAAEVGENVGLLIDCFPAKARSTSAPSSPRSRRPDTTARCRWKCSARISAPCPRSTRRRRLGQQRRGR